MVLLNKAMFAVDTVAEVTEEVVAALTAKDLVSGRRHIGTTMEVEDNDGGSYFVASFHGDTNGLATRLCRLWPKDKSRMPASVHQARENGSASTVRSRFPVFGQGENH